MSEQQLADRLGVARPYLNGISRGRRNPTLAQLERIADALGMALHIGFDELPGGQPCNDLPGGQARSRPPSLNRVL